MKKVENKQKIKETKKFLNESISKFKTISIGDLGYDHITIKDNPNNHLWHHTFIGSIKKIETTRLIDNQERLCERFIFDRNQLNILNPDEIDNKLFWKKLNTNFKYAPVFGFKTTSIKEGNNGNSGIFSKLFQKHQHELRYSKMLEIGYGFGSLPQFIEKYNFPITSYDGIDLLNRVKKNTFPDKYVFHEADGWEIPDTIKNGLDVVFSSNVFQHITFKQKINYLKLSYDKLKDGGYVLFNCIFRSEELLQDKPELWGKFDEFGIPYIQMFDQFIEVDDVKDVLYEITKIGYQVVECTNHVAHHFNIVLKK